MDKTVLYLNEECKKCVKLSRKVCGGRTNRKTPCLAFEDVKVYEGKALAKIREIIGK